MAGNIVYAGGTFDLFHAGHADFFRACRYIAGSGGKVVVALNQDEFVSRFKGHPPVCSYWERRDALLACRYVDDVVPNIYDENSTKTIEKVRPNFIAVGDDWAGDQSRYCKQMGFGPRWLIENGIQLVFIARQRPLSSTQIKNRIWARKSIDG